MSGWSVWGLLEEVTKEARRRSEELQALSSWLQVKVQPEQRRRPWESSKVKSTADQRGHKGCSHSCPGTSPSSLRRLESLLLTDLFRDARYINTAMKNGANLAARQRFGGFSLHFGWSGLILNMFSLWKHSKKKKIKIRRGKMFNHSTLRSFSPQFASVLTFF